jgi:hypothetical protein
LLSSVLFTETERMAAVVMAVENGGNGGGKCMEGIAVESGVNGRGKGGGNGS